MSWLRAILITLVGCFFFGLLLFLIYLSVFGGTIGMIILIVYMFCICVCFVKFLGDIP